ncbi:MAG: hypothetical protein ACLGIE_15870 [Alphaproteobacteria bacterium]
MAKIITLAHQRPARMSKKFREVLRLHEIEGMSVTDACAKVSYSRAAYYKACKNPAVKELLRDLRRELVESADAKKAFLKFKALEVAFELMTTSKSEAIRARMVEFLASDAKVSPVAVHIDARPPAANAGYVYPRPRAAQAIDHEHGSDD